MLITIEFPDPLPDTVEYETLPGQRAEVLVEAGIPVLYVNRKACAFLARLFAQLAHGRFTSGYHLHLGRNFDPEAEEALRVVVSEEAGGPELEDDCP